MKKKCLLKWDTHDEHSLRDRHECIRLKNHDNDHVCYCGESEKQEVKKQIMRLPITP